MPTTAAQDRLGDLLVRQGLVTQEQLQQALRDARENGTRVGYSLVKLGFVAEEELTRMLSKQYRVPAVDLDRFTVKPEILKRVPGNMAVKHLVLPLRKVGRTLTVAMANPTDLSAIDDLKFITRMEIEPVIVGEYTLRKHLDRYYDVSEDRMEEMLGELIDEEDVEFVEDEEEDVSVAALQEQVDAAPVVKFINGLLTDAVNKGVCDIHIEPYEKEVRVRYRIDGALQEVMKPPFKMKAAITSRIKILADLNIAERRVPQDGRIKLKMKQRVVDFRVSTLPVIFGEKIVLRILDKGNLTLDLEKFGMEPKAEKDFMEAILNPYGMVLVTGPTGSGKTTTLYSALSKINTEEVNIMTAEDPVEYNLHGINQVLVRNEIGMTFAAALKAFLRQDPNIIMVGEIRDIETGGIAIKAALTGHLVLSTLHTNDAPSTVTRLIDMGLEPFNVASALNLVTAQRLVRRICTECKTETTYTDEHLEAARVPLDWAEKITFYKGEGCDACGESGYKGRQGLYEVMAVTSRVRKAIMTEASTDELQDIALEEGMLT
ncbi:MAG: type IV-A pilus assembly ATPase PilB, partial [Gemmatimonadetes bacterium]|nr:type IV-A pilus assembly ATPase PilB [Gemmatimonadota bacterium]NIR81395.1 type IV-A pilus assembly ATPase PilB [Gemmatimonadota bacterium]NIT90230.1 type IV-A pilus assembly ATPase PilB [Gemmatimonadota bacterium]NIU34058.1 type IV-A pilus assembly ATPase PilB [Gemmatimonadota bacterium]NIU38215.1 type IV-A pilus assembly ATPase PilB [Gemmatimonadota bacterium]